MALYGAIRQYAFCAKLVYCNPYRLLLCGGETNENIRLGSEGLDESDWLIVLDNLTALSCYWFLYYHTLIFTVIMHKTNHKKSSCFINYDNSGDAHKTVVADCRYVFYGTLGNSPSTHKKKYAMNNIS